jgi:phenylacetate-CoA ligase
MVTKPVGNDDLRRSHRADVAAGILAHARRLRWSKAQLENERQERLRDLLAWAVERSPFHAERLTGDRARRFTEAELYRYR